MSMRLFERRCGERRSDDNRRHQIERRGMMANAILSSERRYRVERRDEDRRELDDRRGLYV